MEKIILSLKLSWHDYKNQFPVNVFIYEHSVLANYSGLLCFYTKFEVSHCKFSKFVLILQNHFCYQVLFISICILGSTCIFLPKKKKVFWDLRGTALNPQTYLGKIALVTLLSLSIHKHEVSFYLLRDPLISLSHVLQLPAYKSCPFVRFIPNYLFFVALINRDCY